MPRSRVLSFMSQWGGGGPPRSPTSDFNQQPGSPTSANFPARKLTLDTSAPRSSTQIVNHSDKGSPSPTAQQQQRSRSDSRASRPMSMLQTFQPPLMDVLQDTLPELQPIFTFLNSHSNKLYQEGYFLKLHDLDSRGRPSADRVWNECFAQLVGTVLSLWDAAALDAAGEDGEVVPTFVNLSDASVKMIESLPMNSSAGGSLQNVLSISTAANNRYLLHFNSLNSLTQWTAGIRLSIYEHATLQEAYTGSLIAGKGKVLNNIRAIMERSKFKSEDWARVRFGAGTPWRRCWCVISPPDEKEYQKAQKTSKKRDAYDRRVTVPKGNVKFYDTRKVTKKTRPIATITDAYAAYAIYPQSKPLIDQSTLVKIEGLITIHASPETTTEGFVFVMPEVHPAVTGFEMMLRFLFPVFDTFALYGRPNRLIADTLDQRGLMFAMPRDRRYGYLDILDVSGLIHTEGSQNWSERQWRQELKKLTSHRMNSVDTMGTPRRNTLTSRTSLNLSRGGVRFGDQVSTHSTPATRKGSPTGVNDGIQFAPPRRTETAPMSTGSPSRGHNRSASEAIDYRRYKTDNPSRLSYEANNAVEEHDEMPPPPPLHGGILSEKKRPTTLERVVSEAEEPISPAFEELKIQSSSLLPAPVASPPGFVHSPGSKPARAPYQAAELRRANSSMDTATLQQLADATGKTPQYENEEDNRRSDLREVATVANNRPPRMPADASIRYEGMVDQYAGQYRQMSHLTTIPGSPYNIRDSNKNNNARINEASPPPVPIHKSSEDYAGIADMSSPTHDYPHNAGNLGPGRSINRKPVPIPIDTAVSAAPLEPLSPPSPSSNGSLRNELMDHAALEQMLLQSPGSVYSSSSKDEDDSVDYASTKAPSPPKKPINKPRTGRLKTVGDPDLQEDPRVARRFDPQAPAAQHVHSTNYPPIDFGPTLTYKPTGRPNTAGSMTPGPMPQDGDAPDPDAAVRSSSRLSMLENRRNSYFEGRRAGAGEAIQENRRSIAWQPAAVTPGEMPGAASLTPEQWVQHRASLASQPMMQSRATPIYSHGRQQSSGNLARSTSKTPPPLGRPLSGDWSKQTRRTSKTPPLSRTQSGDWTNQMPSRPQSRATGALLNPPSPGKVLSTQASHLSAREQMHVARATGSPLLNLSNKDKDRKHAEEAQAPGLVGAMAARERERAAVKEGMRSGMVQQAIAARQQQQAQAEMEARLQAQYQAQQYAQHQAQAYQLQLQQQQQQQQLAYQTSVMGARQSMGASVYGSRPSSQYFGQMQPTPMNPQGGVPQGQEWEYAGVPQQQAYSPGYYQRNGYQPQQQSQQRRYQH